MRELKIKSPPDEIDPKELVGRRAFGKDKDIFSRDAKEPLHYKLDVFIDKRPGGLSIDRFGVDGQVQKGRVVYLDELAVQMADKRQKSFRGWAQFAIKEFHELTRSTEADGEDNPFHAEIDRSNHPTDDALRSLAYHLCVVASRQSFRPCNSESE